MQTLPTELLRQVGQGLQSATDQPAYKHLAGLSICSHFLHSVTEPLLYRDSTILSGNQSDVPLAALTASRERCSYLRQLTVGSCSQAQPVSDHDPNQLDAVIMRADRLTSLVWHRPTMSDAIKAWLATSDLQSLQVHGHLFESSDGCSLQVFGTVETLHLQHPTDASLLCLAAHIGNGQLRRLTDLTIDCARANTSWAFEAASWATFVDALLSSSIRLHTLEYIAPDIAYKYDGDGAQLGQSLRDLLAAQPLCKLKVTGYTGWSDYHYDLVLPALTELRISVDAVRRAGAYFDEDQAYYIERAFIDDSLSDLIRRLDVTAPALQKLVLRGDPRKTYVFPVDVVAVLVNARFWPHITYFELHDVQLDASALLRLCTASSERLRAISFKLTYNTDPHVICMLCAMPQLYSIRIDCSAESMSSKTYHEIFDWLAQRLPRLRYIGCFDTQESSRLQYACQVDRLDAMKSPARPRIVATPEAQEHFALASRRL
ncbi:uncharacterized protein L969DRAFT_95371 [Mixia osmundae IAM 14324]|uniref:Uncharacterized protein n=1 Tax=Mixia osmundae (strain CBS 9802 / IAM 14324 / JCM 22182 / KY 12970) TaxID=764103 RepID=G7DZ65_MIXOS|nr:uncharacterized protein L969DRAFT_95371 [Mixia osmundae IAM 14324]KEI38276.1 hypothetical protein L969DRAFT_95371 [Mixia osmundae IAM 14324]GAA95875.1 hypothetical protein E5Q_02532 [Mixia osmundae IAM 14324]